MNVILSLFGLLGAGLSELADLFFHVLEMLVKLIDQLGILLLLRHHFLRLLLHVIGVNLHESL